MLARPDSTLVALTTDETCDVYTVCDELLLRGWFAQPQLPFRDGAASLHLSLSAATAVHLPAFLDALREAVAAAQAAGPVGVDPDVVALLGTLDPATLDDATMAAVLAAAGMAGAEGDVALPQRMAPVQALLAACPTALREALLIAVVERLSA
jgi:hypothetical protein